eukprot:g4923.t1
MDSHASGTIRVSAVPLELFPDRPLNLMLFRDVSNCGALRACAASRELDVAVIDVRMLVGSLHLLVAANKALVAERSKLITKQLHSELVYSLAPTRDVGKALRTFGASDGCSDVLVAFFCSARAGVAGVARRVAWHVTGAPVVAGGAARGGAGAASASPVCGSGGREAAVAGAASAADAAAPAVEIDDGCGLLRLLDDPARAAPPRVGEVRIRELFKVGQAEVPLGAAPAQLEQAVVQRISTKEC